MQPSEGGQRIFPGLSLEDGGEVVKSTPKICYFDKVFNMS